jgi:hypothetical protein
MPAMGFEIKYPVSKYQFLLNIQLMVDEKCDSHLTTEDFWKFDYGCKCLIDFSQLGDDAKKKNDLLSSCKNSPGCLRVLYRQQERFLRNDISNQ